LSEADNSKSVEEKYEFCASMTSKLGEDTDKGSNLSAKVDSDDESTESIDQKASVIVEPKFEILIFHSIPVKNVKKSAPMLNKMTRTIQKLIGYLWTNQKKVNASVIQEIHCSTDLPLFNGK
jgi:hypothetical protein